ncbi:MAG: DUF3445 domain-containing protein [Pseudomonadota bacterium]
MTAIFQTRLPDDMAVTRALPGVQPERGPWLRVDEAYAGQMARREALLEAAADEVLYLDPAARPAAEELLATVLAVLPGLGYAVAGGQVTCPDGRVVAVDPAAPMRTLGRLCQADFVIMEKRDAAHVLTGAVLCFPASWRLRDKAGRALIPIHAEVAEYDDGLAARVQRLFDGVQVGRPLWRFNQLWYQDPELYQPRSASAPRRVGAGMSTGPYYRTERQTILRLPETRACVFVIHTLVLRAEDVPELTAH